MHIPRLVLGVLHLNVDFYLGIIHFYKKEGIVLFLTLCQCDMHRFQKPKLLAQSIKKNNALDIMIPPARQRLSFSFPKSPPNIRNLYVKSSFESSILFLSSRPGRSVIWMPYGARPVMRTRASRRSLILSRSRCGAWRHWSSHVPSQALPHVRIPHLHLPLTFTFPPGIFFTLHRRLLLRLVLTYTLSKTSTP
jgi:hypothetical protein